MAGGARAGTSASGRGVALPRGLCGQIAAGIGAGMEELLLDGSLGSIHRAIAAKKISVSEIARWYLARIEALDRSGPKLNAIRTIAPDALDVARQFDNEIVSGRDPRTVARRPDYSERQHYDRRRDDGCRRGCGPRRFKPAGDATLARRLRAAGALISARRTYRVCRLRVRHDALRLQRRRRHGEESARIVDYGRGLGSSVGSAAAVASSLTPIAIGSETQNSIQTPACVSSIFGFKPSVGMVSRAGVVPLVPSQDSPGPLARSVEDAALVMSVIAGADCRDSLSLVTALDRRGELRQRDPKTIASACRAAASPIALIWKISCPNSTPYSAS